MHSISKFSRRTHIVLLGLTLLAGVANAATLQSSAPSSAPASAYNDPDPILERATLTLTSLDHGKAPQSGIWVRVIDRQWNKVLVRWTNAESARNISQVDQYTYKPGSTHVLELPIERSRYYYGRFYTADKVADLVPPIPPDQQKVWHKSNCEHIRYTVGLMANGGHKGTTGNNFGFENVPVYSGSGGEDTWNFDATLTLYFDDGSTQVYKREKQSLHSVDGQLVLLDQR